jgi:glycosyltransferase involved in cell wall biosynthesis
MLASVLPHAADAWRVAYWAWELPNPPLRWPEPKGLVDEIWTPSAYARASLLKRFDVPVRVVPHVVVPPDTRPARKAPRPFTVLTLADSRSSFRRKNPAGAIRAFARAFGNTNAAKLIVKLNGNSAIDEILHKEAQGLENIEVIDRFLDDAALRALFCSADVLLSLHRAEGFGIPMLEAMALGVPVIATGWSGNLDFMNHSNSVLIPVHLVPVDDDSVYFRYHDSVWAEPDEAAAADALRQLQADPDRLDRLSQQAFDDARAWAQGWTIPQ